MSHPLNAPSFREALADYLWLLRRGYPEKRSRQLVSDRHRLTRPQRTALLRGVFPPEANRRRSAARISSLAGTAVLAVDGTNVLATLCNYLYGRSLFIATDGFLRDDGENYPSGADRSTLERAAELLADHLAVPPPERLQLYLDISAAPSLAPLGELEEAVCHSFSGRSGFQLIKSPQVDRELTAAEEGAIASSDSAVIDRCPLAVYDAALQTLREAFSADIPDLRRAAER